MAAKHKVHIHTLDTDLFRPLLFEIRENPVLLLLPSLGLPLALVAIV